MATQSNAVEAVSPAGELINPVLIDPDTRFDEDGIYKTKLKAKGPLAGAFRELIEKVQREELERQIQSAEGKKKGSGKRVKLADLPVEEDEDGNLIFNFRSKARVKDQKTGQMVDRKVALFDAKGKSLTHDVKLGTDTVAHVSCFVAPFYTALLGAGVTLRLRAVKLLELKAPPTERSQEEFGFT
ncbi:MULTISPECIES: hypothetical protein [unclassified Pseudomonas]|uniref:hypothetical protein n=1 Tax=unclassified Pseudomonas TaxID=196821 RepID=UPI00131C33C0|nr:MULTISPECIES: hypothetical protein [unclassified Pseudomonas]